MPLAQFTVANAAAEIGRRSAVDHVEEAVLRRLQQHLARLAVDREVGEHDVLRAV
jgi:hypothetical protein